MAFLSRGGNAAGRRLKRARILYRATEIIVRDSLFLDTGLRSSDLAKAIGTNRTYLWQALHERGFGFQEYLSRFRICYFIENAAGFSGMQGMEIAERCGFNDKKALNKYLKKALGVTFTEYMKWNSKRRGPT